MLSINNFFNRLDSRIWHAAEKFSAENPSKAPFLAVPILFTTFTKNVTYSVARTIGKIFVVTNCLLAYQKSQTPEERQKILEKMKAHSWDVLIYTVLIPVSPFYASLIAVIASAKMLFSPLKTAKIHASEADLNLFLAKQPYYNKDSKNVIRRLKETLDESLEMDLHFANEEKFAKSAWKQFTKKILSLTPDQAKEFHFVNSPQLEEKLAHVIALKKKNSMQV